MANYGQMTAGGWMYIGPQGIVHGTYSPLLNAARAKLGVAPDQDLQGCLFVSSGLGGMSGAQGKAIEIAGGVGLIAEVDESRILTRQAQGWISEITDSPVQAFAAAQAALVRSQPRAIAFHGNVVDLLAHAVEQHIAMDLLSDQTSCHAAYEGGYCPRGLTFVQRTDLLRNDPRRFAQMVDASLKTHFRLIRTLVRRGLQWHGGPG